MSVNQAFYLPWQARLLVSRTRRRQRARRLWPSEIMMILILFHQSHYQDFKVFYTTYVLTQLRGEFPGIVSYTRLNLSLHS